MTVLLAPSFQIRDSRSQLPELIEKCYGTVLELGPGPGSQVSRYNRSKVKSVIGVEPNETCREALAQQCRKLGFRVVDNETGPEPQTSLDQISSKAVEQLESKPELELDAAERNSLISISPTPKSRLEPSESDPPSLNANESMPEYHIPSSPPLSAESWVRNRIVKIQPARSQAGPALKGHDLLDGQVDCILTSQVLCSVTEPEKFCRELYEVLKPGGMLVVIEHVDSKDGVTKVMQRKFLCPNEIHRGAVPHVWDSCIVLFIVFLWII